MDIWVTWAKRKSKCAHCPEPVLAATQIVRGKEWRRRPSENSGEPRRFCIRLIWHFDCWVAQAKLWLDSHPYEEVRRKPGRKCVTATKEDREVRTRLLRAHASLAHRQRTAALDGDPPKVMEMEFKKQALIQQIALTGPVPSKWIPK